MTLVAAAVIVLVTWGSPRELAHLQLTGVWLLFVGLGLQIILEFVDIPKAEPGCSLIHREKSPSSQ